jgi:hypothetical protein
MNQCVQNRKNPAFYRKELSKKESQDYARRGDPERGKPKVAVYNVNYEKSAANCKEYAGGERNPSIFKFN